MSISKEELIKIKDCMMNLSVSVESHQWGPSYEFAKKDKSDCLSILNKHIRDSDADQHRLKPQS